MSVFQPMLSSTLGQPGISSPGASAASSISRPQQQRPVDNRETPLLKTCQVQCGSHPPSSWSVTWGIHPSPGSGGINHWDHSRAPMVRAIWSCHLMEYWWGSEVGQQSLSWLFLLPSSTIDTAPPDSCHQLDIHRESLWETVSWYSNLLHPLWRRLLPEESLPVTSAPAMGLCHRSVNGWVGAPWKDLSTFKVMEEYIEENLQQGYIRPSTSPAASSFFFVASKDGGLRPCIDYRALNKITVKFRYPLPLVPTALKHLWGATVFSKLDLRSAYNLIQICKGNKWKNTFVTPTGHILAWNTRVQGRQALAVAVLCRHGVTHLSGRNNVSSVSDRKPSAPWVLSSAGKLIWYLYGSSLPYRSTDIFLSCFLSAIPFCHSAQQFIEHSPQYHEWTRSLLLIGYELVLVLGPNYTPCF